MDFDVGVRLVAGRVDAEGYEREAAISGTVITCSGAVRVLVVNGEPIGCDTATGITLSNLFRSWPTDCLFETYTANLMRGADCDWPAWKISNADLAGARRFVGSGEPGRGSVVSPAQRDNGGGRAVTAGIRTRLVPWLDFVPYSPPAELIERLEAFRPQVIYSMLGNIRLTRLAVVLGRRFRIPVVPHFMDDWLTTYAVPGRSGATIASRIVLRHAVTGLMRRAPMGFAIGDQMAEEYARRFSRPFEAFMNPVDLPPETVRDPSPVRARLGYVGGLHLSRHVNLLTIARAVSDLKARGMEIDFSVWAPPADIALHGPALRLAGARCGSLSAEEAISAIRGLDIAVHVEAFGKKEAAYTRLSVSTKIPQYLASGAPVLAYGPAGAASCRYIVENGCGVGVGDPDRDLNASLRTMIEDVAARRRMAINGRRLAAERHDALIQRARFRTQLARAAAIGPAS